ncbi:MAG: hypothetical protein IIC82_05715, partial [Chloroflexi bacterium]|nr:hypothetical protein [Chloroflexota bacterium]
MLEALGVAAVNYAAGWLVSGVKNRLKEKDLEKVYSDAAERVLNFYDGQGISQGTANYRRIVELLGDEDLGTALSPGGRLDDQIFRHLRYVYNQEEPDLRDILGHIVQEVDAGARATLPMDDKTVVDILSRQHDLLLNDLREQSQPLQRIEKGVQELLGRTPAKAGGELLSTATNVPNADDYRVPRPELEAIEARFQNEAVVGIGGPG